MFKKINTYLITLLSIIILYKTNNVIVIFIGILINSYFYLKDKNFTKYMYCLFITYVMSLLYFTIFTTFFHRVISFELSKDILKSYLADSNFIPFKTITFYISKIFNFDQDIYQEDLLLNLAGNFICFIPFAVFIPYFFPKFKTIKKFAILLLILVLSNEMLQFFTGCGAFDIDDVILNFTGCFIFYCLFYKDIIKFYQKELFTKSNTRYLRPFFIKVTITILLFISTMIFYYFRKKEETIYWDDYHNQNIILISDLNDDLSSSYFLYEDDLYKYYLIGNDPSEVIISVNNHNYYLSGYTNGNTKYYVSISDLINANLNITKIPKYSTISVCIAKEPKVHTYPEVSDDILEFSEFDSSLGNSQACISYYLIPKSSGEVTATFSYEYENTTETKTYHFIIDKSLNITYTEIKT